VATPYADNNGALPIAALASRGAGATPDIEY